MSEDPAAESPPVEPNVEVTRPSMGEVILSSSGMTIKAGGSFELPIKVDCPSVLRIRFEVEDGYDVDFSLKFLENADKAEVQTLVEPARSTAREGQLDIHTTGTCFVIWDNAFSWINSKELTYHLSLKSKEDIEKERVAELARLAELRKQAAIDGAAARREKRAEMVVELEGKVADMMAHQHQARNRLAAKQVELKELERRYLAAKAGIEAVAQVADTAETITEELQAKLSALLDEAAADQEDTVE